MTTKSTPGEVVAVSDTPTDAAPLSFKDATAQFAKLDAFASALTDYVKRGRADLFSRMSEKAEEDGTKSFNVTIDGSTVASLSITEPKDKVTVSDRDALVDWVLENFPSEVETIVQVRPSFESVLLKRVTHGPEGVFDPETAEEVPGLKHIPAPEPSSFSLRWKGDDLKKQVLGELMTEVAPVLGIEAGDAK